MEANAYDIERRKKSVLNFSRNSSIFTQKLILPDTRIKIVNISGEEALPYVMGVYGNLWGKNVDITIYPTHPVLKENRLLLDEESVKGQVLMGIEITDTHFNLIRNEVERLKKELGLDLFIYSSVVPFTYECLDGDAISERTKKYVSGIRPWAKDYFRKHEGTIIGIPPLGTRYGESLKDALVDEGLDVEYSEKGSVSSKLLRGKKLLIVDSVSTESCEAALRKLEAKQEKLEIPDFKFAVEYDPEGIADWSLYSDNNPEGAGGITSRLKKRIGQYVAD